MSEYFKKFETLSQFQTYRNSANFIKPNVSLVTGESQVYYDPWFPPTFAGMEITEGNMYYSSNSYRMNTDPFANSFEEVGGVNEGSYYFTFSTLSSLFGGSWNTSITNTKSPIEGEWRLPSLEEYGEIFGTNRDGSTVNSDNNVCFVSVSVDNKNGTLLFPDGEVFSGPDISNSFNDYSGSPLVLTRAQLDVYLNTGRCRYFSASGYYNLNSATLVWLMPDSSYLMTSTQYSSNKANIFIIPGARSSGPEDKDGLAGVVRLVRGEMEQYNPGGAVAK
jgi:hypothetical protein